MPVEGRSPDRAVRSAGQVVFRRSRAIAHQDWLWNCHAIGRLPEWRKRLGEMEKGLATLVHSFIDSVTYFSEERFKRGGPRGRFREHPASFW
jgi:hypothetical protein